MYAVHKQMLYKHALYILQSTAVNQDSGLLGPLQYLDNFYAFYSVISGLRHTRDSSVSGHIYIYIYILSRHVKPLILLRHPAFPGDRISCKFSENLFITYSTTLNFL